MRLTLALVFCAVAFAVPAQADILHCSIPDTIQEMGGGRSSVERFGNPGLWVTTVGYVDPHASARLITGGRFPFTTESSNPLPTLMGTEVSAWFGADIAQTMHARPRNPDVAYYEPINLAEYSVLGSANGIVQRQWTEPGAMSLFIPADTGFWFSVRWYVDAPFATNFVGMLQTIPFYGASGGAAYTNATFHYPGESVAFELWGEYVPTPGSATVLFLAAGLCARRRRRDSN